jgi:CRP/FNR family transcriptional activator FtrB
MGNLGQAEAIYAALRETRPLRPDELDSLAGLPLFCSLSRECLLQVTAEASVIRVRKGEPLIHQGQAPHHLHVVLEGQVGLLGSLSDGEETVVEILQAGEVFIAAAVLTDKPYLMGAQALQDCRLLLLPAERLRRDLNANAQLAVAMLTSLSRHFRKLVREVKDLKLKSAAQRLALYLVQLTPKREGAAILRLPHSKSVMAARIGIRAETLSRAFASLKAVGVAVDGRVVTIADLALVSQFCLEGDEVI